ncbi:MAG TPA: FHA domain-containing protein [Acidobacteriota bacterium]|nr:FHA domain-containing protein [Acidobacteriota bacterium]
MNQRKPFPTISPEDWAATPPAVRELLDHLVQIATEIELVRTRAASHDDPDQTHHEVHATMGNPIAKLVVLAPNRAMVYSFPIFKKEVFIGRIDRRSASEPDIDLSEFDIKTRVSRRHARIFCEDNNFYIEDLGSVNGTVINDSRKLRPNTPYKLNDQDEIRVGSSISLMLRTEPATVE